MNRHLIHIGPLLGILALQASSANARTADDVVESARQAAKADRHPESIAAYRQAMEAAPDRRSEWIVELADQLTWAGQCKEAIPLYREASATNNFETERRARRGLARALSWDGDHPASLIEYDRVLVLAPEDLEVRLARAEVLSWNDQQDEALAAYRNVLRDHPEDKEALRAVERIQGWLSERDGDQTVDNAVELARMEARANRHIEATEAFRRAMRAAPERRNEWLLELADQLTWSGQRIEAIALYREAIAARAPEQERAARRGLGRALSWEDDHAGALAEYDRILALDPTDREVRLARAQVLSWANQQSAALAAYQAVLRDHPEDAEARRGVARVQSWRGRHRDAVSRMQEFLLKHPHDREATAILAESYEWMGRMDRAEKVLREQIAADCGDSRSASLLDNLEFQQRPVLRFDWREAHQSDDVRTSMFSFDSRIPLADGGRFVGFRYDLANFVPPTGPVEEIRVQRPGLLAHYRLSDGVDWHGGLSVDLIDTRGASGDHEILTYDTYLTLRPNDLLRFDVGSSRWTFDSQEGLRDGLSATQGNVSMDIMPDEIMKYTGRFSFADYSDGNERTWWQFEMERRIWHDPDVVIGYRYTGFDFSNPWQRGYYSPDLYHSNEILVRANGWFADGVRWQMRSTIGYEQEQPGDSRLIWSAGGSVAWEIRRQLEIELAYDYSSSSAASSDGFDRGIGRLGLRYTF